MSSGGCNIIQSEVFGFLRVKLNVMGVSRATTAASRIGTAGGLVEVRHAGYRGGGGGGGLKAHDNQLPAAWERGALFRRPAAVLPPFRPCCPLPAEEAAFRLMHPPPLHTPTRDNGRSSAFSEKRALFAVLCLFIRYSHAATRGKICRLKRGTEERKRTGENKNEGQ